jgi:hypothetical protein
MTRDEVIGLVLTYTSIFKNCHGYRCKYKKYFTKTRRRSHKEA